MVAFLEVTALLEITLAGSTIDGSKISLRGNGSRLEVDLPDLRTALLIKRHFESMLNTIDAVLRSTGLVLSLRLQSAELGRLGYGAEPTFMGRLAGCSGLELRIFPFLWAVSRSFFGSNHRGKRT